jgi:hypothetical protein
MNLREIGFDDMKCNELPIVGGVESFISVTSELVHIVA